MDAERLTLPGPWMGRYNYASAAMKPVAFNATLFDEEGNISGETIEPNTFSDQPLDALMAGIIGVREETWLRFTKSYSDFEGSSIDYEGRINATFTRVDGTWSFPTTPRHHGTFVLIRDAVAVDAQRRRTRVTSEGLTRF